MANPNEPPVIDAAKRAVVDEARRFADDAAAELDAAAARLDELRAAALQAEADAKAVYEREHAEEIEWHRVAALANHDRHEINLREINLELEQRRAAHPKREDGSLDLDPDSILTFTVDGHVHVVVERLALKLGHKGSGDEVREGSRFKAACAMSVDAPHDELVAVRFVQGAKADCPACEAALAAEVEVVPSFNPPAQKAETP